MTIDIKLSDSSINSAIRKLQDTLDNLKYSENDLVEVLAHDGAAVAQAAYGSMAHAEMQPVDFDEAKIVVSGGDKAIIAEFGAGYAVMEWHPFAKNAPVPIKVGSYSEQNDGLFYWSDYAHPGTGYWYFGKKSYDRVQPRHGLLDAYDHILTNYEKVAEEVFKL